MLWVLPAAVLLLASSGSAHAGAFSHENGQLVLKAGSFELRFADTNGSILAARGAEHLFGSASAGLWQAFLQEGGTLQASDFRSDSPQNRFTWAIGESRASLSLAYSNSQIMVVVTVASLTNGAELAAEVRPTIKTVSEFALPGRLRFAPASLNRFVGALNANESVGAAFKGDYFRAQPEDSPAGWQTRMVGPGGYISLFGSGLVSRADNDPATNITITAEGRAWLGEVRANRLNGALAVVNRPSARNQTPLVLADSPNGPYFCGSQLSGQGWFLRIGGSVREAEKPVALDLVLGAIEHLVAARPPARTKIGLLSLVRGPASGGWAEVTVSEWRAALAGSSVLATSKVEIVELATPREMLAAAGATNFVAILNPYGEWTPVLGTSGMSGAVSAVRAFVRAGGCWIETGGYPFYYEMRPAPFYTYETPYPPAFADFMHLDTVGGPGALFGVQPQVHAPWSGAIDTTAIFVPGRLMWGGDPAGGYCERRFGTRVPAGLSWKSPRVRILLGPDAETALGAYAEANALSRRLEQKLPPEVMEKLKRSVLVYYSGSCAEKLAYLDKLPSPALIHFADYLKGGFDKEYPDHLPPNAAFGTTNEFRAFLTRCRESGHLVMPYTNPTWWCDHPRGPTFLREGEAPLLRLLDGSLSYERYGDNDGYTVCHWHPAVREANARTLRQFTEEFPVDLLFQDQCGARSWQYDLNPASPSVYAYSDGLVSMVAEDCRTKPLSTENGWDRIANYEAQFCGMTWAIVPTKNAPSWRVLMKDRIPPALWDVFPLAQHLAHDKVAMVHHDLGQFVTDDEVLAWTLALGYGLSARLGASELAQQPRRDWLWWLDRLQKSVCARFIGEPLKSFVHDRAAASTNRDDGIIRATYGAVQIVANLGSATRAEAEHELAANGFVARAPGMLAARLAKVGTNQFGADGAAFVVEGTGRNAEFWLYSPGDRLAAIEMPDKTNGLVELTMDGESPREARLQDGVVQVRLGMVPGASRLQPPGELANRAPVDWPAGKPAIGVLDIPGMPRSWTSITPSDWYQGLTASRLATGFGAPIRRITSYTALVAALQSGPTAWLAIINPGGEVFPEAAAGQWQTTLGLIRDYVNRGGSWWETAGYSFYVAAYQQGSSWQTDRPGPSGMAFFGLPVDSGAVDQPPEAVPVTHRGQEILGDELANQLRGLASSVNRGLPRTQDDPGHVAILGGSRADFAGGYRLSGWGFLWRIGGFSPNRALAIPAAIGVLEYLYSHPPMPVDPSSAKYFWHGRLAWKPRAVLKTSPSLSGGVEIVVADCPPGAMNYLERASVLDDPLGWADVFKFQSPAQETNWLDPDSFHNARAFYRIRSDLAP